MVAALQVFNLTKTYRVFKHRQLLATQPIQMLRRNSDGQLLYALNNVSFEVRKGEIFGIIGHNGSGKSTLLKILSGITRQDTGAFRVEGRVTSLLELGVGFEQELTGRENIYLYGSLIGLDRSVIQAREAAIIEFSGIREFIDTPVKSYSSGMLIRLAFATAIHTDPDVLLLDEVLGVGDDEFRHRSFQAIQKAVERGVTVVIVSHGLTFVGNFCSRVMCLHQGEVAAIGPAEHVVQTYMDMVSAREMICEIAMDNTRLRFLPGGFHIEHDDRVYTVVRGCSVNLRKWEADFQTSEAAFEVVEHQAHRVVLKLSWGHWNLEQFWTIGFQSPYTIEWIIENGPNLHEAVDGVEIETMVSGVYASYILPEEIRRFPDTVNRGFNMEYLLAQQQPRGFLGVTDASDDRRSIVLDYHSCPLTGSSQVISGGNLMPGHMIKREFAVQPGDRRFHTAIHLMDRDQFNQYFNHHKHRVAVASGALVLQRRDDEIHLVWKDQVLSRSPGFHVSFNDLAPGPADREWETISTPRGFILREVHVGLPVVTVWMLAGDGTGIQWRVLLEILDTVDPVVPELRFPLQKSLPLTPDFSPAPVRVDSGGTCVLPVNLEIAQYLRKPGIIELGSGVIRIGEPQNE